MISLVLLYCMSLSRTYFLLNLPAEEARSYFSINKSNCLSGTRIVMALDGFSALQFVPPAPKVKKLKNRLFPIKPLPLCKPLRFVQFGQRGGWGIPLV